MRKPPNQIPKPVRDLHIHAHAHMLNRYTKVYHSETWMNNTNLGGMTAPLVRNVITYRQRFSLHAAACRSSLSLPTSWHSLLYLLPLAFLFALLVEMLSSLGAAIYRPPLWCLLPSWLLTQKLCPFLLLFPFLQWLPRTLPCLSCCFLTPNKQTSWVLSWVDIKIILWGKKRIWKRDPIYPVSTPLWHLVESEKRLVKMDSPFIWRGSLWA